LYTGLQSDNNIGGVFLNTTVAILEQFFKGFSVRRRPDRTQNYDSGRTSHTPFSMSHRFIKKNITKLTNHD